MGGHARPDPPIRPNLNREKSERDHENDERHPLVETQAPGLVRTVDAQTFDEEPHCGVARRIEPEHAARTKRVTAVHGEQNEAQHRAPHRFIEERRMKGGSGFVTRTDRLGIADAQRPRQISGSAEEFLIEPVAPTAHCLCSSDGRGCDGDDDRDVESSASRSPHTDGHSNRDAAPDAETPLPHLQRVAEAALGERLGSVVAIELPSGAIRAAATWPRYDPAAFETGRGVADLLQDPRKPLLDRPVQGLYPPGSTFKVVTMAAAMAHGLATPDSEFTCTGTWTGLPGVSQRCWLRSGHGTITLADGLTQSCNSVFYELGKRLDALDASLLPATAAAVMELLRAYEIPLKGRPAVVVGRSAIVGRPVAQLLEAAGAHVEVAHSKTPDLGAITRTAAVLVVAAGVRGLVRGEHVSPGTIVIDVGIHPSGDTIVGDVDAASVEAQLGETGGLSPVPGGVGPMTSAVLALHAAEAAERLVRRRA